jgi:hypothetical protein
MAAALVLNGAAAKVGVHDVDLPNLRCSSVLHSNWIAKAVASYFFEKVVVTAGIPLRLICAC